MRCAADAPADSSRPRHGSLLDPPRTAARSPLHALVHSRLVGVIHKEGVEPALRQRQHGARQRVGKEGLQAGCGSGSGQVRLLRLRQARARASAGLGPATTAGRRRRRMRWAWRGLTQRRLAGSCFAGILQGATPQLLWLYRLHVHVPKPWRAATTPPAPAMELRIGAGTTGDRRALRRGLKPDRGQQARQVGSNNADRSADAAHTPLHSSLIVLRPLPCELVAQPPILQQQPGPKGSPAPSFAPCASRQAVDKLPRPIVAAMVGGGHGGFIEVG